MAVKRAKNQRRPADARNMRPLPYETAPAPRLEFWLVCATAVHAMTLLLLAAAHPDSASAPAQDEQTIELSELSFLPEVETSQEPPLPEPSNEPEASSDAPAVAVTVPKIAASEPAAAETEAYSKRAAAAETDEPPAPVEREPPAAVVAEPGPTEDPRMESERGHSEGADAGPAPGTPGLAEALRAARAGRQGNYGEGRRERGGLGRLHGQRPPDVATIFAPHPSGPIRVDVFDNTQDILVQVTGTSGLSLAPAMAGRGPEVSMPRIKLPIPGRAGKPVATGHARRFERKHSQLVLSSQRLKEMPPGLIRHRGSFFIGQEGEYRFRIVSQNPALLRIDGDDALAHRVKVYNRDGALQMILRPTAPWEKNATVPLDRGSHTFELLYWHLPWPQKGGTGYVYEFGLELFVKPPGKREQPWTPIPE
jgi:hypothetical protein